MKRNNFVKFNSRLSKNIYLFDIYSLNDNKLPSSIVGYAIVNIKTRKKYASACSYADDIITLKDLNELADTALNEADNISEFFPKQKSLES